MVPLTFILTLESRAVKRVDFVEEHAFLTMIQYNSRTVLRSECSSDK
jgi:hypothetical protein